MPLFNRYLIVDWSASNAPKTGKDSIWLALHDGASIQWVQNVPTRLAAIALVRSVIDRALADGKRLFAGFDFAFGYPKGASKPIAGADEWQKLWQFLAENITDDESNANNAFTVAGELNREVFNAEGPFWGHPHQHGGRYPGLKPTKDSLVFETVPEYRHVEKLAKGAKSVWQLAYNGTVGRQAMLGIAHLQDLRTELSDKIAIWPFETRFSEDLEKPIVVAEIYPSIFDVVQRDGEVKDAAQVRTVAAKYAELDMDGKFGLLLDRPQALDNASANEVLREEGWIVGVGAASTVGSKTASTQRMPILPKLHSSPFPPQTRKAKRRIDYIRDPAQIYEQSFETVRREVDLSRLPNQMYDVAIRLIHACGMIDIVNDLAFSDGAAEVGALALKNGAAIICDVEMVKHGIIRRHLGANNEVLCGVADDAARAHASQINNTRSAAAMDLLKHKFGGAIIVIGNAPTAMFRVLELIDEGAGKPALIIGMPVGFVGAAESKDALIADSRGIPFIAVKGRRGGSAMASATLNAVAAGLKGGL